jgi:hypothetical protein
MVHIPGKKSRVVPVLILPLVKEAMDLLVDARRQNHIAPTNKYFFATESVDGHLFHFRVLRKVATEAGLPQPELIGSTKLRKYLATMAQVRVVDQVLSIGNLVYTEDCKYVKYTNYICRHRFVH